MIPDEAVEAAAKVFARLTESEWPYQHSLGEARQILEAAAPHLMADMRPMTMVEIANRDHPERMDAARKKLQEGAREARRIERKQIEAKALVDAAKRLQQDNPANAVMWLRDQGRAIGIAARQEAEEFDAR